MLRNANPHEQQATVFILVQGLAEEQDALAEEQDGYKTPLAMACVVDFAHKIFQLEWRRQPDRLLLGSS